MSPNYTAAIDYWGFKCPKDSKFYICENTWAEFIGCCGINPCADGSGLCRHGLKALSYELERSKELPVQDCLPGYSYWMCYYTDPPFAGCCGGNPCGNGCPTSQLGTTLLSRIGSNRLNLLYPSSLNSTIASSSRTSSQTPSTLLPSSFKISEYDAKSHRNPSLSKPQTVVGVCSAILIAVFFCFGLIIKYWKNVPSKTMNARNYASIANQEADRTNENITPCPTPSRDGFIMAKVKVASGARRLKQTTFTTYIVWVWNIVLTLVPTCFIALAIVVVDLDGRMKSSFGQRVLELTKLSPSLYPILFAAVAGRFYKNLARYCLEQPGGVRLAVLEQVFGSQSFATAVERVFFVHTHMFLSVVILSTWALSPLGGQSSSRILQFGNATEVSKGTVNYLHPAYQTSSYLNQQTFMETKGSVAALYSSSLLSSLGQKRSPRDMWELPKIPQLKDDETVGETYVVDQEALERGRDHYASLLGVKLQGLGVSQGMTEHNFTVQTSYINLDCNLTSAKFNLDYDRLEEEGISASEDSEAIFYVQSPLPWERWKSLDDPPPLQFVYFSQWPDRLESSWSATNCTVRMIWLETDIHCGPQPSSSSCYAYQQRRIKDKQHTDRPPSSMTNSHGALKQAISLWLEASGDTGVKRPQATENYIMGELHPYSGHQYRNWSIMDPSIFPMQVSKRLTTAFNTFWDATINPLGHTNVSFGVPDGSIAVKDDRLNATIGAMTQTFEVYRVNQLWVAILLTATMFLQILAILGLILETIIVGPEVLGFASSLTRDNLYVPVPPGNSAVGGAERARLFRDLRLQIADMEPGEESGYIAVHALQNSDVEKVSTEDPEEQTGTEEASGQVDARPLGQGRLYR